MEGGNPLKPMSEEDAEEIVSGCGLVFITSVYALAIMATDVIPEIKEFFLYGDSKIDHPLLIASAVLAAFWDLYSALNLGMIVKRYLKGRDR